MRDLSKLQIGLIGITTVIAVVFALFFIEFHFGQRCALPAAEKFVTRCGNGFSNWLYDFQSLITGAFAVVAAAFTVRTMNKNTRDVVYAEWKMVVYNVDFHARGLKACIATIRGKILKDPPSGDDLGEWASYMYAAEMSLQKLRDILVGAQQQALTSYSLASISNEIDQINNNCAAMQSFRRDVLQGSFPLTTAEKQERDRLIRAVQTLLRLVEQGTQFAFEAFVANSRTHNPMTSNF